MQIRGREVDFKISRLKDAGSMDLALKHMSETEKKLGNAEGITALLAEYIKMFQVFFVEATGTDVLEGCEDAAEAKQAYIDFLREVRKQKDEVTSGFSLDDIK